MRILCKIFIRCRAGKRIFMLNSDKPCIVLSDWKQYISLISVCRKLCAMKALIFAIIFSGLCTVPVAFAQQVPPKEASLSKSQAAEKAQKQVRGRVLKVEQDRDNYRVKVLKKSGRVVSVDVDKKSGRVKRSEKDEKH